MVKSGSLALPSNHRGLFTKPSFLFREWENPPVPKPERENGFASQETGEEGQEDNMKEMMSSVPETSASLSISHTPKKPLMPGIQGLWSRGKVTITFSFCLKEFLQQVIQDQALGPEREVVTRCLLKLVYPEACGLWRECNVSVTSKQDFTSLGNPNISLFALWAVVSSRKTDCFSFKIGPTDVGRSYLHYRSSKPCSCHILFHVQP